MHQEITAYGCSTTVLVPFPLAARSAEVRSAAALLMLKHQSEEAATDHWVRITDRLADSLTRCGFDPIVIATELCRFEDAVDTEIERRQSSLVGH